MDQLIKKFPDEIVLKAQNTKAIIVKVEGVLTSAKVLHDKNSPLFTFNLLDDSIVKPLRENGIIMIAITFQDNPVFRNKIKQLSYDFYQSSKLPKIDLQHELSNTFDLDPREICFIGNDLTDLPYLKYAGLSVCTNDSVDYIKSSTDYVTNLKGGEGVLREIADLILAAQGKLEKVTSSFFL